MPLPEAGRWAHSPDLLFCSQLSRVEIQLQIEQRLSSFKAHQLELKGFAAEPRV